MFLLKLKVTAIGTSRSRILDADESHVFELPLDPKPIFRTLHGE